MRINIVPFGVRIFNIKEENLQINNLYHETLWLRIPTGRRQTVWVSISMAEKFNLELPEQIKLAFGLALKPGPLDYAWDAPSTCLSLAAS